MVLEYVADPDLSTVLARRGKLSWRLALTVARDLAAALGHAHAHGIVHRDLKPSNIFLGTGDDGDSQSTDTTGPRVKVTDFGLAKLMRREHADLKELTSAGTLIGSALYMSPEQCQGQPADFRSDLYALGCVFYHCLFGRPPYGGDTSLAVIFQHASVALPLPPDDNGISGLPPDIVSFLRRLMAKDPAKRPGSASQVEQILTSILADTQEQPDRQVTLPAMTEQKASKPQLRFPLGTILAVIATLAIGLICLFPTAVWQVSARMMCSLEPPTAPDHPQTLAVARWLDAHGQRQAAASFYAALVCPDPAGKRLTPATNIQALARLAELYAETGQLEGQKEATVQLLLALERDHLVALLLLPARDQERILAGLARTVTTNPPNYTKPMLDALQMAADLCSITAPDTATLFRAAIAQSPEHIPGAIPLSWWGSIITSTGVTIRQTPNLPAFMPTLRASMDRYFRETPTVVQDAYALPVLDMLDLLTDRHENETAIEILSHFCRRMQNTSIADTTALLLSSLLKKEMAAGQIAHARITAGRLAKILPRLSPEGQVSQLLCWQEILENAGPYLDATSIKGVQDKIQTGLSKLAHQNLHSLRIVLHVLHGPLRPLSDTQAELLGKMIDTVGKLDTDEDRAAQELLFITLKGCSPTAKSQQIVKSHIDTLQALVCQPRHPLIEPAERALLTATLAEALSERQEPAEALVWCNKTLALISKSRNSPGNNSIPYVYTVTATNQLALGQTAAAEKSFYNSLASSRGQNTLWRVQMFLESVMRAGYSGHYDMATRLIATARVEFHDIDPSTLAADINVLRLMMYAHACWQDKTKIQQDLAVILKALPVDDKRTRFDRCLTASVCLAATGDLDAARTCTEQSHQLMTAMPYNWEHQWALADACTLTGDQSRCAEILSKAVKHCPPNCQCPLHERLYLNSLSWTKTPRSKDTQAKINTCLNKLKHFWQELYLSYPAAPYAYAALAGQGQEALVADLMATAGWTQFNVTALSCQLGLYKRWPPLAQGSQTRN